MVAESPVDQSLMSIVLAPLWLDIIRAQAAEPARPSDSSPTKSIADQ
jgi:hypothetical protein